MEVENEREKSLNVKSCKMTRIIYNSYMFWKEV